MRINDMSVESTRECMGSEASRAEAAQMLRLLLATDYYDTREIPDSEWIRLEELAIREA
jgi:hypothetical protein